MSEVVGGGYLRRPDPARIQTSLHAGSVVLFVDEVQVIFPTTTEADRFEAGQTLRHLLGVVQSAISLLEQVTV